MMGFVLDPIFNHPYPPLIFFISFTFVLLAVMEIYLSRVSHHHSGMLTSLIISLVMSVFTIGFLGNAFAIQIKPFYKATQFIPILGMVLFPFLHLMRIADWK
jgi:ABC-type iron transport system FetAB permease component